MPAKKLAPANGTMARYRLQEWLNFITSELHKGYRRAVQPGDARGGEDADRARRRADRLKWVDAQLEGKSYLMGDAFSVADAYLFTVTNWTKHRRHRHLAARRTWAPSWRAWRARPAVQEAMKAEGLLK